MFRNQSEMTAHQFKYFLYSALLILLSINAVVGEKNLFRRRPGGINTTNVAKQTNKDGTEKLLPDQNTAATGQTTYQSQQQRREGDAYTPDVEDFAVNNVDINVIHPDKKPLHTKITTKYTSRISIPSDSLENSETAEEYVAKAVGMFGSHLREPIRIPESSPKTIEPYQQQLPLSVAQQQPEIVGHANNYHYYVINTKAHQEQQQQQQEQQQQQTQMILKQQQQQQHQQQQQQPSQNQYRDTADAQAKEADANAIMEAQIQQHYQEQLQQAQYLAKVHLQQEQEQQQKQQSQSQPQPQTQQQPQNEQSSEELFTSKGSAVYQKDGPPITFTSQRNYNYDYEVTNLSNENPAKPEVDRTYRTKYIYKPVYHPSAFGHEDKESDAEDKREKLRVSASTEIPKAEIMKQIEKSVIKYMKELEAEGKIIATPKTQEMKNYFKPTDGERSPESNNLTPRYTSTPTNYQQQSPYSGKKQTTGKHEYSAQDLGEALAPNVEFVYKIKTRAPLQTTTVKTISKPYMLPMAQFDHASALKNIEEFDHSHVIAGSNNDEYEQPATSAASTKSNKLYFNSEIYHDIKAGPMKQKQRLETDYRKLKPAETHTAEYKGYGGNGYFVDSSVSDSDRGLPNPDEYTLLTPYQYMLKKEHPVNKYEDAGSGNKHDLSSNYKYKAPEYENYSQRYNNNQDAYNNQQHNYKGYTSSRHSPGKRGKRGGSNNGSSKKSVHRNNSSKDRDIEPNFLMRPSLTV